MPSGEASATRDLASAGSSLEKIRLPDLPQEYPVIQALHRELRSLHEEIDQLPQVQEHNLGDENMIKIQGAVNGFLEKVGDLCQEIVNVKATISYNIYPL